MVVREQAQIRCSTDAYTCKIRQAAAEFLVDSLLLDNEVLLPLLLPLEVPELVPPS
jgi:hypothetical protein